MLFWIAIGLAGILGIYFLWKGICFFGFEISEVRVKKFVLKDLILSLIGYPLIEELLFRGPIYFLSLKSSSILVWIILILSAIIFGLLHWEFGLPQIFNGLGVFQDKMGWWLEKQFNN